MGSEASKDKVIYPDATFINHKADISCISTSDDLSMLATGSDDFSIRVWTTEEKSEECAGILYGHNSYVTCLKIHDAFLISGSDDTTIRKWNLASCECEFVYEGHTNRVLRIICSDEFIFSSCLDATAKAWHFDAEDEPEPCVRTFQGHEKSVLSLIFLPERDSIGRDKPGICAGDTLLTGSSDCKAMSWSLQLGQKKKVFAGHKGPISMMVMGDDHTMMFTASTDTTIRKWNIHTGECKLLLEGHKGPVLCMQLVGNLLYSGDGYGEAHCRFKSNGDLNQVYKGHRHSVVGLKFHRGRLYTVSSDTCGRAFDAGSGRLKYIFRGHTKAVTGLAIVGNAMFSISSDCTLRRWKLHKTKREEELEEECEDEDDMMPFA